MTDFITCIDSSESGRMYALMHYIECPAPSYYKMITIKVMLRQKTASAPYSQTKNSRQHDTI